MATGRIPRGRTPRGWSTFDITEAKVDQGNWGPQLALVLEGPGKMRDWLRPEHLPYLAEALWGSDHEGVDMATAAQWLQAKRFSVDVDVQDGKPDGDGGYYPAVAEYAPAGTRAGQPVSAAPPASAPAPAPAPPAPAPAPAPAPKGAPGPPAPPPR